MTSLPRPIADALAALRLRRSERDDLVHGILEAAESHLIRYAESDLWTALLHRRAMPILTAAAAVLLVSVATILWDGRPGVMAVDAEFDRVALVEDLAVPAPMSAWVIENRGPTTDDLMAWIDRNIN